jgi:hypothetical protein
MNALRTVLTRRGRGFLLATSVALLVTLILGVAFNVSAQEGENPEQWLLAAAAQQTGQDAANLEVLNFATANYQALGEQAIVGKMHNRATGEYFTAYVDLEGNPIDRDLDAENLAAEIANGPIHPTLSARLAGAGPDEQVSVVFWVPDKQTAPNRPDSSLKDAAAVQAAMAEAAAARETALAAAREGFLAAMAADGFSPEYVSPSTPAIYATLPAGEVQRLAAQPDVVHVFLSEGQNKDLPVGMADSDMMRTSRSFRVHKWYSISGAGIQVGVVECCGHVYWNNLYQGHPFMRGINTNQTGCANQGHATAVTGFINSGHTEHRAEAYNAHINFDSPCDGSIAGTMAAYDWVTSGAGNWSNATNHSYGLDTNCVVGAVAQDAHMDDKVRNSAVTSAVAAGNGGNGAFVESPAIAYNNIAVGALDDMQTYTWGDDVVAAFSSGVDPCSTHGDREKPEVAAAGVSLDSTTTAAPWIGNVGSGTSFATPLVTAAAAVLQEAKPSLYTWPEEVKAILMATAWHNVEGLPGTPHRLGELAGAGGIDAWKATQLAFGTDGSSGSGSYSPTCSGTPTTLTTFAQSAGRRVRVVMVWDTDPTYANYPNQPSSDLDLRVTGPGGFAISSASNDNTYEIVAFTTPAAGLYTVEVWDWRCSEPSGFTYLGWAWARLP